jgi:hypothetical protein
MPKGMAGMNILETLESGGIINSLLFAACSEGVYQSIKIIRPAQVIVHVVRIREPSKTVEKYD